MDNIRKLQQALPDQIEAILIQDAANRFYLTGMKSSAGTVLITKEKAWLIIDFRYFEEAQQKVKNCTVIEEQHLFHQVSAMLLKTGIRKLSIHSGRMTISQWRQMKEAMPQIEIDATNQFAEVIDGIRKEKDETEIENHRHAQQITDTVFSQICGFIRPGITELEIAQEIGTSLTKLGSDDRHFNFIVASGPNSSLPHGFATNRPVQNGDFVTMDFGAVCGGYLADMTRTVAVGFVTEEQRKIYNIVLEAQKRAFEKIRSGVICREVDAEARNYIYGQGYQGCFSHGLGHSIGVEVHENPRFNEICEERLRPGMVITVEPGIYLRGRYGVRIEDMIVIQDNGFENLTKSPKELIIL